jgi:hypothetical protein
MAHQGMNSSSDDNYPHTYHNPLRSNLDMWNGWTIGSYVQARLSPCTHYDFPWCEQTWTPALLVDIWKDAVGVAHFVVAHLYTRRMVARHGMWVGLVSLLAWPHKFEYVLSNHLENVDVCQLRTWRCATTPSVAQSWTFNSGTSRLERTSDPHERGIVRALNFKHTFPRFLQLPREIRDCIYEIALIDEHQRATRSRIYARSILQSRDCGRKAKPFRTHCTPTLGPLPSFQTPGILRASRQVRLEALETVYRTKLLVITITSMEDVSDLLEARRLPEIRHFLHVRFELVLFCVTSTGVRRCLQNAVTLLRLDILSPQFLQITIAHSHINEPAENSERAYLDMLVKARKSSFVAKNETDKKMIPCVVADGMRDIALLCCKTDRAARKEHLHISWGVSEDQRRAGDYSCVCTYLCATYLHQLWRHLSTTYDSTFTDLIISEETCQHMGCRAHRC